MMITCGLRRASRFLSHGRRNGLGCQPRNRHPWNASRSFARRDKAQLAAVFSMI